MFKLTTLKIFVVYSIGRGNIIQMNKDWVCHMCGKHFNPLQDDSEFSFNCPECGSEMTAPNSETEKHTPENWEKEK